MTPGNDLQSMTIGYRRPPILGMQLPGNETGYVWLAGGICVLLWGHRTVPSRPVPVDVACVEGDSADMWAMSGGAM